MSKESASLEKVLEQLGYKQNEAKTYLAALAVGESTASDIAKKLDMPRTSVQVILERLNKDGLMHYFEKKRYTYWVAEAPQKILSNLKEKESMVLAAMPTLLAMRHSDTPVTPTVKMFKGVEEIKSIYTDIFQERQPVFVMAPWDAWNEEIGNSFFERISKKGEGVGMQFLTSKTKLALEYKKICTTTMQHMRFLPDRIHITDVTMLYGDKAAIISLNKTQSLGILINDKDISNTKHVLFEELWKISTEN